MISPNNKHEPLFCSTIVPTIGRPSLDKAVQSVLSQQSVGETDFEVIVVNDSGKALSHAEWQNSERVTIIETYQRERSVARNVGASIARGEYLHFLDDDDWMAPNALHSFWKLAGTSNAGLLYGVSQLLDRQHKPLLQLKHQITGNAFLQTMAGEWIPLQASFVKSSIFFGIGGFNSLLAGPEDNDLLRRVTLHNDVAETQDLVAYVVIGPTGSSTYFETHHVGSRWARELILDSPDAYARMREGTASPFWHGRLARVYLTSTIWNLRHKKFLMALSRAAYCLHAMILASSSLLSSAFWRSLARSYQSETFARGLKENQGLTDQLLSQNPAKQKEAY